MERTYQLPTCSLDGLSWQQRNLVLEPFELSPMSGSKKVLQKIHVSQCNTIPSSFCTIKTKVSLNVQLIDGVTAIIIANKWLSKLLLVFKWKVFCVVSRNLLRMLSTGTFDQRGKHAIVKDKKFKQVVLSQVGQEIKTQTWKCNRMQFSVNYHHFSKLAPWCIKGNLCKAQQELRPALMKNTINSLLSCYNRYFSTINRRKKKMKK